MGVGRTHVGYVPIVTHDKVLFVYLCVAYAKIGVDRRKSKRETEKHH